MRIIGAALYSSIILASSPVLAADCLRQKSYFVFGADTQTHLTVKAGKICGGSFDSTAGVNAMRIEQMAQHGVVGMAGKYRWAYRPAPGYTGKDSFIVQISGEMIGGAHQTVFTGKTNFIVDVDVVP